MPTIQFTVATTIAPAVLLQALTDFSADRPKYWRNIDADSYKVHEVGDTWADVTEGSGVAGGVWERTRYDWSQPGLVTATLTDSNSFAPGSYWKYKIEPDSRGGSRVECTVRRLGKGVKGRLIASLVGLFGKRILRKDFELMLSQLTPPPTKAG